MAYKIGLYPEWWESIESLSLEDKGKILDNIFSYSVKGEIEHKGYIEIIFNFMKNRIDADKESYENKCHKNQEIGKLGGRPKKTYNNLSVISETQTVISETQTVISKPNSNSNSTKEYKKENIYIDKKSDIVELIDKDTIDKNTGELYVVWTMIENGYKLKKTTKDIIDMIYWVKDMAKDYLDRKEDGFLNWTIGKRYTNQWSEYFKTLPSKKQNHKNSIRSSFNVYKNGVGRSKN